MSTIRISLFAAAALLAVGIAACGGGGGGGGGNGGGGGAPPSTPTPAPGASGQALTVAGADLTNASVDFTCGCSAQAGTTTTDGSGNYTLTPTATATPNAPSPTYTMVPGRNYMVIAADSTTHAEAWTIFFLGSQPSHNVYMGPSSANTTDKYTIAAALYIFAESANNSDQSFDDWNFNAIQTWTDEMRTGAPTTQETQLLTDITNFENAGTPLYPSAPAWDNDPGAPNTTILNDVDAIKAANNDPDLPTPCPLNGSTPACTGTPSP